MVLGMPTWTMPLSGGAHLFHGDAPTRTRVLVSDWPSSQEPIAKQRSPSVMSRWLCPALMSVIGGRPMTCIGSRQGLVLRQRRSCKLHVHTCRGNVEMASVHSKQGSGRRASVAQTPPERRACCGVGRPGSLPQTTTLQDGQDSSPLCEGCISIPHSTQYQLARLLRQPLLSRD